MTQHHFYADNLVDVLLEEGIPSSQIWELNGWKENEQGYYWTSIADDKHDGYDGIANGHLYHHTASSAYTPYVKNSSNQTKCCVWAGMRRGDRLYQDGGGVPTLALASAGPADYSAGSGVADYIADYLTHGLRTGKQRASDDTPKFYGNRYVWNTEIVCDGVGGSVTDDMWDLLIAYGSALSRLHDSTEFWNGFHAGFTKRKIDYRDGRFANAEETLDALWIGIGQLLGGAPLPPGEIMGCPWTNTDNRDEPWYDGKRDLLGNERPPCDDHFDLNQPLVWGVNTGMCNVPEAQEQNMIDTAAAGIWKPSDGGRDMYDEIMVYGRTLSLINRAL